MQYHFKKLKSSVIGIIIAILLLCGCESAVQTSIKSSGLNDGSNLLTTKDFIDIELSAAEGSGSIRTLTLHYMANDEKKSAILDDLSMIDHKGYDNEAGGQTFSDLDSDQDGIIEITVYQEFWFPDLTLSHPEVPLWPTIYEFDLKKGFVVASVKYKAYFKTFAENMKEDLNERKGDMSDAEILALKRLIYAAERIADGSFSPSSLYSDSDNYYTDVYDFVKNISE